MYGAWYCRAILNGGAGAAAAVMPEGALGIWYASDYDAATNSVPNAVLSNTPSANYLRGSRRLFSRDTNWVANGATLTDAGLTAPDGSSEASTLVAAGDWFIYPYGYNLPIPAGTYTLAVSAQRNTGSDQQFKLGDFGSTLSATQTATSAWQRFSHTFTTAGGAWPMMISFDRATGASLRICDLELFAGEEDLGPVGPDGNLYLGALQGSASPVVSGNSIDMTGQGYGLIQLPTAESLTNVTAMAVVSKTAAGSDYQAFLSKVQAFADFSALTEKTLKPETYIGGSETVMDAAGLWALLNRGYHTITHRYDGTDLSLWLDDILLFSVEASVSPYTIADLWVGIVATTGLYSGLKVHSIALYGSALTDEQIRTAHSVLSAKATVDGLTMATSRILVTEGDSITSSDGSYAFLFGANANPAVLGNNIAKSGSVIGLADGSTAGSMFERAATVDSIIPPTPGSREFVISVLIGANDLVTLGASTFLERLAAYCDARRLAGWTVVVCTALPNTTGGFNAERATANTAIRTWVGVHADAICDFDTEATMGIDGNGSTTGPWDTTYYSDGLHPTAAGQALLEAVYRAVINAL
jgi:lysophospholipase L1-like esterase